MDNDIVQGEEGRHTDDEEGETERLPVKQILDLQSDTKKCLSLNMSLCVNRERCSYVT